MTLSTTHCALRVEEKFAYQVASGDLPIYTNSRLSKQRNCRERLATDAGSIQTALYIAAPPAKGTESKNKKRRGTNARRTKSASYLGRSFELIKTKSLLSSKERFRWSACVHVLRCAITLVPPLLLHAMDKASDAEPRARYNLG